MIAALWNDVGGTTRDVLCLVAAVLLVLLAALEVVDRDPIAALLPAALALIALALMGF